MIQQGLAVLCLGDKLLNCSARQGSQLYLQVLWLLDDNETGTK